MSFHQTLSDELTDCAVGFVQRARRKSLESGNPYMVPQIHGLLYNPATGELEYVDLKIREKASAYGKVYDVLHE